MSSLSFRRAVVALALGWILVSPLASAELGGRTVHRRSPSATQEVPGVFGQLWEALVSLFSKVGSQPVNSSVKACDNGMTIDPDGRCNSQPYTSSSTAFCENGASADPFGRCPNGN
jgi:hypothetical protein